MIKLDRNSVLTIYNLVASYTGGSVGVKDEGLLLSALEAPYQTFGGNDLFKTDLEKIVRLGYGLVSNHPFIDGNKRIGILVMMVLLELYGYEIDFKDEEVVDMAMGCASGKYKYNDLLHIINSKL